MPLAKPADQAPSFRVAALVIALGDHKGLRVVDHPVVLHVVEARRDVDVGRVTRRLRREVVVGLGASSSPRT